METLFDLASKQVNVEEVPSIVQEQMKKPPVVVIREHFSRWVVIERIAPNRYKVTKLHLVDNRPRDSDDEDEDEDEDEDDEYVKVLSVTKVSLWALEKFLTFELRKGRECDVWIGLYKDEEVTRTAGNHRVFRLSEGRIEHFIENRTVWSELHPGSKNWFTKNHTDSMDDMTREQSTAMFATLTKIAVPIVMDMVRMIEEVEYE